ncbi:putative mediator of RNA polymerase II transcription subunit 26 [Frankliniella occidentalis]|uniref:Mediator of RNA polymerase II transcription subunit 26 n=1 Tax=Frankliniella occidentalis TaxID=133901 RepID=A0A6J1TMH2_FRAOC|nr:putative mediator of RNA polymerase II transcription subunit 26 [Frankliniella occidentalis]
MKTFAQVAALTALLALQASAYTLFNTQPYYVAKPVGRNTQPQQCQSLPSPVLLLAERACGSPGALSEMPMVVVAQDSVQVVRDGQAQVRVAALNSQLPYASVAGPALPQGDVQALRAVRVELRQPVYISSLQSTIPFPDSFIVVHGVDGGAAPLAIRTVLAPVPAGTVLSPALPIAIKVLYAVPLDPFNAALQHQRQPVFNNYYESNFYADAPLYQPQPALPSDYLGYGLGEQQHQLLLPQRQPQQQFQVHFQPRPQYQIQQLPAQQYPSQQYPAQQYPIQQQQPQQTPTQRPPLPPVQNVGTQQQNIQQQQQQPFGPPQAVQADGSNKPGAPIVTILDFPSAVATPDTLFYQPEDPESELGNRRPPQAVSPAGIVQSTQPQPNLSVFVNSKESAILQGLRDESEKQTANRLVQAGLRGLPAPRPQEQVNPELESVSVDAFRASRSSDAKDAPKADKATPAN